MSIFETFGNSTPKALIYKNKINQAITNEMILKKIINNSRADQKYNDCLEKFKNLVNFLKTTIIELSGNSDSFEIFANEIQDCINLTRVKYGKIRAISQYTMPYIQNLENILHYKKRLFLLKNRQK